jgi:hypothetical protein
MNVFIRKKLLEINTADHGKALSSLDFRLNLPQYLVFEMERENES